MRPRLRGEVAPVSRSAKWARAGSNHAPKNKMKTHITFPNYTGIRCLMMPYIQGRPETVPAQYRTGYENILDAVFFKSGEVGFLTIDESHATKGTPHRGTRAKFGRALHTEAGWRPGGVYGWGGRRVWGSSHDVTLDRDTRVLLANNVDGSCALWGGEHEDTTADGDIGHLADQYPLSSATLMAAGDVHEIGILTPHESLPVETDVNRQFLRIISSGVHGREPHFTENPLLRVA